MRKQKKVNGNGHSDRERKIKEKEDRCVGDFDDVMKKIKEITDYLDNKAVYRVGDS